MLARLETEQRMARLPEHLGQCGVEIAEKGVLVALRGRHLGRRRAENDGVGVEPPTCLPKRRDFLGDQAVLRGGRKQVPHQGIQLGRLDGANRAIPTPEVG